MHSPESPLYACATAASWEGAEEDTVIGGGPGIKKVVGLTTIGARVRLTTIGARVRLAGLTAAELNGKTGNVVMFQEVYCSCCTFGFFSELSERFEQGVQRTLVLQRLYRSACVG